MQRYQVEATATEKATLSCRQGLQETQNKKEKYMGEKNTQFKTFATMLDCSRNAVMNVDSLKKWISLTAGLGYNALLLYTEETYEIDGQPYFGYMRGRYTQEELKEIDSYARSEGMELIPCIQTLAHLNAIVRWPDYAEHIDTEDILLAGDEFVYELIDRMFETISQCFTSRTVNIGMDEAHMIGRGKYYDLHGDRNRSQILIEHVKRVSQIGKKYGFTLTMWSDMFFRLAAGGEYYDADAPIDEKVREQIPDNVELVYWDYYSAEKKHYDGMISAHQKLKEGTWFAGGLWCWSGFAPHNGFSMHCNEAALASCREHGVSDVLMTLWGDNGNECSKFAVIPALFHAAELANGNIIPETAGNASPGINPKATGNTCPDNSPKTAGNPASGNFPEALPEHTRKAFNEKFLEKFGISFDDFLLLDLPGTPGAAQDNICNPDKYLLYNDCFTGLLDTTVTGDEGEKYAACAKRLSQVNKKSEWGYLFETQQALCEVLAIKADLGIKTRKAYAGRSKEELEKLMEDYRALLEKLEHFYKVYKRQWFAENKPHGFDVQDIRLGGLIMRTRSCLERLEDLHAGNISVIEELEEKQLDIRGPEECRDGHVQFNSWSMTVTANVI